MEFGIELCLKSAWNYANVDIRVVLLDNMEINDYGEHVLYNHLVKGVHMFRLIVYQ